MRHDMFKVVVERPRHGGLETKGRKREKTRSAIRQAVLFYGNELNESSGSKVIETPSNKEKIRPVGRGSDRKGLSDNLNPLWGYLRSRVGCCWDDVYSDIRCNISTGSTMQMHVVQHLKWQVIVSTYLGEDGKVYDNRGTRYGIPNKNLEEPVICDNQFYVHPVTRKLCVSPTTAKKERARNLTKFQVSKLKQFRRFNNEWKVVEFERIPDEMGVPRTYISYGLRHYKPSIRTEFINFNSVGDVLSPNGIVCHKRREEYGFGNIMAQRIRPLGKREKKILKKLMEGKLVEVSL